MNGSKLSPQQCQTDDAVLHRLARDMVIALDEILGRLLAVAPAGVVACEVPLTLHEAIAIKKIPPSGTVSMTVLASSMGISLPTATHLVDRLVAKGIAVRTRSDCDRRMVLVALSEQTKAHQKAFFDNRVQLILSILEPFGAMEREQVVKALCEIARLVQSRELAGGRHIDSQ